METERNWNGNGRSSAQRVAERTEEVRENVRQKASVKAEEAREQMRSVANSAKDEIAEELGGFARAMRSAGDQLRADNKGRAGYYTELLGEQADRTARYLSERDSAALAQETESFARRQPLIFLGGCALAGFAIGRFFKASPPDGEAFDGPSLQTGPTRPAGSMPPMGTQQVGPVTTSPMQPVGAPIEPQPGSRTLPPDTDDPYRGGS